MGKSVPAAARNIYMHKEVKCRHTYATLNLCS